MICLGGGKITGTNVITVGANGVYTPKPVVEPIEESMIVNEDGSGDAVLFENDDTWITE